jgi:hypothetical protein
MVSKSVFATSYLTVYSQVHPAHELTVDPTPEFIIEPVVDEMVSKSIFATSYLTIYSQVHPAHELTVEPAVGIVDADTVDVFFL